MNIKKTKPSAQGKRPARTISIKPKTLTLAIAQALAFQAAQAATVEVTSHLDNGIGCTLREAVASVNAGSNQGGCGSTGGFGANDTITFAPNISGSTITLTGGRIPLGRDVSINPGGSDTTISGGNTSGIFWSIPDGTTINLDHLILTGGNNSSGSGGAIFLTIDPIFPTPQGTLNLTNSVITGNTSEFSGGGIHATEWVVNVSDTTISNNSAAADGGGINILASTLTLSNSTVSGNTAYDDDGGGINARFSTLTISSSTLSENKSNFGGGLFTYNSSVSVSNSTLSGNSTNNNGGGMNVTGNSSGMTYVSLNNSTISDNSAGYWGGGLIINNSDVSVSNSTVSGNSVGYQGGGLFINNSNVSISNSTVSGNLANDDGGGLNVTSKNGGVVSMSLSNSSISGNRGNNDGGGLRIESKYNGTASMFLTDSTFSSNSAGHNGGGLYSYSTADSTASISLINSTVSDNFAQEDGGGFLIDNSRVSLTNSTVSQNMAIYNGGGLFVTSSTVNLTNSTFARNRAKYGKGGGLFVDSGTVDLTNSFIARSFVGNSTGIDCERNVSISVVTAGADNIIENDGCGTLSQHNDQGITTLSDNGGPTQTNALIPGSPAIDGGTNTNCPATDQRGVARDDGACDIGAYEFKTTVLPIAKKDRKMGALMMGGVQWYSFTSTESQQLSIQTNGFNGDTVLQFYRGANGFYNSNDDSGPDLFSNIKPEIISGPHYILVRGKTDVDPYWLRLMSDQDILSFNDTASHFANKEIRVMSSAGITGGCGVNKYCPTDPVTRAQMAIFMLKAILGGNHSSPPASGSVFSDVSTSSFGASFIEEFSTLGITSGCGGGKYCPDLAVTREQMAVFLLRAWYGSSYTPPTATPAEINQFSDIANSFARDWIVKLTKENITGGCGGGKYCPTDTVTRGQMAAFIARTFDLDVEL